MLQAMNVTTPVSGARNTAERRDVTFGSQKDVTMGIGCNQLIAKRQLHWQDVVVGGDARCVVMRVDAGPGGDLGPGQIKVGEQARTKWGGTAGARKAQIACQETRLRMANHRQPLPLTAGPLLARRDSPASVLSSLCCIDLSHLPSRRMEYEDTSTSAIILHALSCPTAVRGRLLKRNAFLPFKVAHSRRLRELDHDSATCN